MEITKDLQNSRDIIIGLYSQQRWRHMGVGIPIISLRRSNDRLGFINGNPYTDNTVASSWMKAQ